MTLCYCQDIIVCNTIETGVMQMWDLKVLNTDGPFYVSIADAIERDIRAGLLKPGDQMPTHRELARVVGVNVTTVTRAYQEAERRGLITATVGRGTFITSDLGHNPSLFTADVSDGGLIELGLALPLYVMEPDLQPLLFKVAGSADLRELTKYTPAQGLLSHRRTAVGWLRQLGMDTDPDHVIITSGTQHAFNCILPAVFQPGDRIAVNCITYPGFKSAAKRCGVRLEAVEMDREGMLPDALEAACSHGDIKGIYTGSRIQNPTGAVMSEGRSEEITRIIRQYGLTLIEDDLYGFLSPEGIAPLSALVPEQSIYISGTSKAFYAGLRIGFVVSPEKLLRRISQAVVDTVMMAPSLNAEIVCQCISSGLASEIVQTKRKEIRRRAALLQEELEGFQLDYTADSLFAWLALPGDWTGSSFEAEARRSGISVISSEKFTVGGMAPPPNVRISLSGTDRFEDFERGLKILRKLLNHEIGFASGIL